MTKVRKIESSYHTKGKQIWKDGSFICDLTTDGAMIYRTDPDDLYQDGGFHIPLSLLQFLCEERGSGMKVEIVLRVYLASENGSSLHLDIPFTSTELMVYCEIVKQRGGETFLILPFDRDAIYPSQY